MKKLSHIVIVFFLATVPSLKGESLVSIPDGILGLTGQLALAPVEIDDAAGVQAFDCTITYDTTLLDLSNDGVKTGTLTSGWALTPNVQDSLGWVIVNVYATIPLAGGAGSLLEFDFHVTGSSGTSVLTLNGELNEDMIPAAYDPGSIITASAPPLPGDANVDGKVDETDAAILAANWLVGPAATWGMGNFNADGCVNDVDATLMAANWHVGASPAGAASEPGAIVLLAPMVLLLAYRRFAGKRKLFIYGIFQGNSLTISD